LKDIWLAIIISHLPNIEFHIVKHYLNTFDTHFLHIGIGPRCSLVYFGCVVLFSGNAESSMLTEGSSTNCCQFGIFVESWTYIS
jgi:hypothetical protein